MNRRVFLLFSGAGAIWPGILGCRAQTNGQAAAQPLPTIASSGDAAFDAWLDDFYRRALAAGLPKQVLDRELSGLTPDPAVIRLDRNQPEFSRPISAYVRGAVSDARISAGRQHRTNLTWLNDLEARFGVPAEILIAIWAMETSFGAVLGDFDVIRTDASLAADGRRRELFETNLMAALRMIASGEATRAQLKGSPAGAMGQTQFAPDTFLAHAIDGDGDGKRDLWGSTQDALASAANYLAKSGWKRGESWQREVSLPAGFDYSVVEGPRLPPQVWETSGVVRADGRGWSEADAASQAQLITPSGAAGPAFLIFPNHFTIRVYNNSTAYALGVGLLASRIGGEAPLVRPWPEEQGLSNTERVGAQEALVRLGYDPGAIDGVIGPATRRAVRAWQVDRRMLADGYLSAELARRLIAEAAALPAR